MATNIINQNLDQYGLQYGEGLNPYAPDVQIDNMPTNRGYTNFDDQEVGIINTDIGNQMADVSRNQLNQLNRLGAGSGMSLNEIKEMSPPGVFDSVTPQEFQQIQDGTFNKDNLVSSIGSGLENFFFPSAGAAEINPNNTFTSSVANSPYEMDYMPPDRYRNFEQRVGTPQTTEEEKLSLFQRGKDLASSGIGKAGKLGMDAFNMLKNNNPMGLISSGLGGLTNMLGGMFEDKQLYADTYDEFGNKYTADQLNSMNARGGYYTDPARASRRRQNSIYRMEKRKADGKTYGKNRLETLRAIEQKAQEARDKATADKVAAFQQQRANETGAGSWGTGDEANTFGENIGSGGWDSYT